MSNCATQNTNKNSFPLLLYVLNEDNVSEWSDIATRGLLVYHLIEYNLYSPWYGSHSAHLALKQQSITYLHSISISLKYMCYWNLYLSKYIKDKHFWIKCFRFLVFGESNKKEKNKMEKVKEEKTVDVKLIYVVKL